MKIARRRITLAPTHTKPNPCPICKSKSGFCVVGVVFTPRQWWDARRSTRRPRSE